MITAFEPKTALVLIDLQNGITAFPTAHPAADVIALGALLLDAFHAAGLPAVIVNVDPFSGDLGSFRVQERAIPADEATRMATREAMAQKGFFDIVPQLKTTASDIFITKKDWSAFRNTTLDAQLKALGVTGLVFAGIATSIGVEGSARAAHDLGYQLAFASDAMTDMHLSAHENSLTKIFPRLGELDTTENIIRFLNRK